MQKYKAKEFNLPVDLPGLSTKQIEVHLGLYAGYVTHVNKLYEQLGTLCQGDDLNYAMSELNRRLGFEFNGMRMHEYYFAQLEGGSQALNTESALASMIEKNFESLDGLVVGLTRTASSRGIGWTVLYWDTTTQTPVISWVSDHELGQLGGLPVLFALDMWEHAFMVDYTPAEKGEYLKSYFKNVNWSVVEERFKKLS